MGAEYVSFLGFSLLIEMVNSLDLSSTGEAEWSHLSEGEEDLDEEETAAVNSKETGKY